MSTNLEMTDEGAAKILLEPESEEAANRPTPDDNPYAYDFGPSAASKEDKTISKDDVAPSSLEMSDDDARKLRGVAPEESSDDIEEEEIDDDSGDEIDEDVRDLAHSFGLSDDDIDGFASTRDLHRALAIISRSSQGQPAGQVNGRQQQTASPIPAKPSERDFKYDVEMPADEDVHPFMGKVVDQAKKLAAHMNGRSAEIETVLVSAVERIQQLGQMVEAMHHAGRRSSIDGFLSQLSDDDKAALGSKGTAKLLRQRGELESLYRMRGQPVPADDDLNKRALAMVLFDKQQAHDRNAKRMRRAGRRANVSNRSTGKRATERKETAEEFLDRVWT